MEIWKAIPGYEGYYEISDSGRIQSITRIIRSTGNKAHNRMVKGRLLVPSLSRGYHSYALWKDHRLKTVTAHAMVAFAFIGPRPDGMYVCHGDGVRCNNRLSNISYKTPTENSADALRHGTRPKGETHGAAKLTKDQVDEIRTLSGIVSQDQIARKFKIGQTQVSRIVRFRHWRDPSEPEQLRRAGK